MRIQTCQSGKARASATGLAGSQKQKKGGQHDLPSAHLVAQLHDDPLILCNVRRDRHLVPRHPRLQILGAVGVLERVDRLLKLPASVARKRAAHRVRAEDVADEASEGDGLTTEGSIRAGRHQALRE
eukprot:6204049-Pleurochrysis_carterae.AAC.2